MKRERMLYIGTCTVCGTGNIGIRVAALEKRVVGMCDECDAIWLDKDLRDGPHFPEQPDQSRPGVDSLLFAPPAHWATRDEAATAGWAGAILGETVAI